jgi:hypothetical protein
MASSSMNSPVLLASAAVWFEVRISPPTVSPRLRTPAWRLASGLTPTDSISRPRAVRRVTSAATTTTAAAISTGTGSPNRKPEPITLKGGLFTVTIWPSVMSMATPRPAVIRIRVATMGCSPRTATSAPFHRPSTSASTRAVATAVTTVEVAPGSGASMMIEQASAPAIAPTAPTDRSMPRVAITSVMAIAMIIVGAPLRAMSTRLPNRWPSRTVTERKPGNVETFTATRTSRTTTGQSSRWLRTRLMLRLPPRTLRRR